MPARSASRTAPTKTFAVLGLCVGILALACGACGRRGALEPPSGTAAGRSTTAVPASPNALPGGIGPSGGGVTADPDAVRTGDELATVATPAGTDAAAPVQTERGAKRGYRIPKQPFVLDPIL